MGKNFIALLALLIASVAIVGCDANGDQQRTRVVVTSLNENTPVVSDPWFEGDLTTGDGAGVYEDIILVQFASAPYSAGVTSTNGRDFLITGYRVRWVRTDGGAETLPDYNGSLNTLLPLNSEAAAFITLVTFNNKSEPFISDLRTNGAELFFRADITFFGREVGSDREQEIAASLSVNFVDVITTDL